MGQIHATLPQEPSKRICALCGSAISQKRRDAVYCSDHCRVRIWDSKHPRLGVQPRLEFGPTASAQEQKRLGKRERILVRLKTGPARTHEILALGGSGMSGRLHELRVAGYVIECEPDEDGAVYRLEGEP